ncbi:citrate/2-methylcitrate synthase [Burkholderia multivorans]|uniref:citrate/2-methylcitrate synthase n=1 Tax=Burkholderia multivorans TaxID=87883 RepID=UPI000752DF65|nr:citrate synthase family protein [Burkholderia multivorans]KVR40754.1 hypothetical protein WK17_21365 [Burkholderia multivorans]
MKLYLTSDEAATQLGVSTATLYAYVSRGLIRSIKTGGNQHRSRAYLAEDVYRLLSNREVRQSAGKAGEQRAGALESRIALIENGRLYYRGLDAVHLARTHSLEQVAAILWETEEPDFGETDLESSTAAWQLCAELGNDLPPMNRALIGLGFAANQHGQFWMRDGASTIKAGRLALEVMVSCVTGQPPSSDPIHVRLARAWGISGKGASEILRMALVLCADHELNPSTYSVRCIASTGTNLLLALAGGIAAMLGPRHGGATATARALIRECKRESRAQDYLLARLQSGEQFPSFGHKLYPDGDPRAALLLEELQAQRQSHASMAVILEIASIVLRATTARPNLDFALAAVEDALKLPSGSALSLFAIGRCVGWIAHAREQAMIDSAPIRPRAIYIGPRPDVPGSEKQSEAMVDSQ